MSQLNTGVGKLTNFNTRLLAVEEVVPSNRTLTTGIVGADTNDPSGPLVTSGGHSYVVAFTAPSYRVRISRIRMYLRGDGSGGAGDQKAKGVAYAGVGLAGLPAASLITQGTERMVTNPTSAQLWEFAMPTTALVEGNAQFSAGVFFDNVSSVNQAMTIPYVSAPANTFLENTDTYADGAVSPFGTIIAGYGDLPLVEVDVESAPATYDQEIAELEGRLDTAEGEINDLQGDVAVLQAGGSSAPVIDAAGALAIGDVVQGEPADFDAGGTLAVTSYANQAAEVSLEDLDAGTWRAGEPFAATANRLTYVLLPTTRAAARWRYVNGATAATVEITSVRL